MARATFLIFSTVSLAVLLVDSLRDDSQDSESDRPVQSVAVSPRNLQTLKSKGEDKGDELSLEERREKRKQEAIASGSWDTSTRKNPNRGRHHKVHKNAAKAHHRHGRHHTPSAEEAHLADNIHTLVSERGPSHHARHHSHAEETSALLQEDEKHAGKPSEDDGSQETKLMEDLKNGISSAQNLDLDDKVKRDAEEESNSSLSEQRKEKALEKKDDLDEKPLEDERPADYDQLVALAPDLLGPKKQKPQRQHKTAGGAALVQEHEDLHAKPSEDRKSQGDATTSMTQRSAEIHGLAASKDSLKEEELKKDSMDASQRAQPKVVDKEAAKAQVKANFQQLESEWDDLDSAAADLDKEMKDTYDTLSAEDEAEEKAHKEMPAHSLMEQHGEADPIMSEEDKQFAALEKQTNTIMQWFSKLKAMRKQRDALKAKKDAAFDAASAMGLDTTGIINELQHSEKKLEKSNTGKAHDSNKHSSLIETEQRMQSVMAGSAVDMAEMESAASHVQDALSAYLDWKDKRHDNTAESQAEAKKIKARLQSAMKFLSSRENAIDVRRDEISTMLRDADMVTS